MPRILIDITGHRYGMLLVKHEARRRRRPKGTSVRVWSCVCDCGKELEVEQSDLIHNKTSSCGCTNNVGKLVHGLSKEPLYAVWKSMKQRCCNSHSKDYKHYGGRGIAIHDDWANSYSSFEHWAKAHGYSKGLQIDRIDNEGDYCPDNCRFVPCYVNQSNRRMPTTNTSGFVGVCKHGTSYQASLTSEGVRYYAGSAPCPREAALLRDLLIVSLGKEDSIKLQVLTEQNIKEV